MCLTNQLLQLEKYWILPNNLLRRDAPVSEVTHKKRKERILCFLGWCKDYDKVDQPDLLLFDIEKSDNNRERYERFLDYLKDSRLLNDGTIVEHITSAIFALKFLFAR